MGKVLSGRAMLCITRMQFLTSPGRTGEKTPPWNCGEPLPDSVDNVELDGSVVWLCIRQLSMFLWCLEISRDWIHDLPHALLVVFHLAAAPVWFVLLCAPLFPNPAVEAAYRTRPGILDRWHNSWNRPQTDTCPCHWVGSQPIEMNRSPASALVKFLFIP